MGELQSRKSIACYHIQMSAQTKVEVTRGVFDPRTYKQEDKQNWARKRKPEWMATTGQIHFVRERTVASQERELEEERKAEAAQEAACDVGWQEKERCDEGWWIHGLLRKNCLITYTFHIFPFNWSLFLSL